MHLHLFEFEDFEWFPDIIRKGQTDYLHYMINKFNIYKPAAGIIKDLMDNSGYNGILDLCSGGGGGMDLFQTELMKITGKDIKITLSDKYPNIEAFEKIKEDTNGRVDFLKESVDVLSVPENSKCIRTVFSAFHHFKPDDARSILKQAVDNNLPIAIFEGAAKDIKNFLGILLFTPIIFLLITPFMRPFKMSRIFFTYIIPLIPITTVWDGLVSILRMYTPDEMLGMANSVTQNGYVWKSGKVNNSIGTSIMYLTGYKSN
ncbi:MAG: class I SAM-dependent methyltransferase [Ignavibacteria bacterium]